MEDETAEMWRMINAVDKEERRDNLAEFDSTGWKKHSPYHYSRDLLGDRIDCWPSRQKFRWRDKTKTGDVKKFIKEKESAE